MVKLRGTFPRELAWTVAGASAGGLARHWVDVVWPGARHALPDTLVVTVVGGMLVGFALAASIRTPFTIVLAAAGGAAGSISAATVRAASATPTQAMICLAVFYVAAIAGLLSGAMVTPAYPNHGREEQY